MHARIQIYWCRSSIFRHLKLKLLTQFPASNDDKYINVVYIWRKIVSFYGYVHWRMTTEISVMYGSEKVNNNQSRHTNNMFEFSICLSVWALNLLAALIVRYFICGPSVSLMSGQCPKRCTNIYQFGSISYIFGSFNFPNTIARGKSDVLPSIERGSYIK